MKRRLFSRCYGCEQDKPPNTSNLCNPCARVRYRHLMTRTDRRCCGCKAVLSGRSMYCGACFYRDRKAKAGSWQRFCWRCRGRLRRGRDVAGYCADCRSVDEWQRRHPERAERARGWASEHS